MEIEYQLKKFAEIDKHLSTNSHAHPEQKSNYWSLNVFLIYSCDILMC
ncbi:unnamed protein product [Schistosoma mattheei]|uniref:Uncharacterized protein n=1 Tax=Schistosoma mattheei TaxID=31246 RepID=A0A183PWD4_9TREM|nr:unnamed protein product [Schistosoma mattheei]